MDEYGYRHKLRICNTPFPRQQLLRERASLLSYTYTACRFFSRGEIKGNRAFFTDEVLSEVWVFRSVEAVFALLGFLRTAYFWLPDNPQMPRPHEVLKF
jgi:hypothetical protein